MRLAIIGGGASGLMCASYLKRNRSEIDITIYERNKGLGRKLLASGNGKCNFMNFKATIDDYNNPMFVSELFKHTNKEDVLNYFSSSGLLFKFDDEGRMYPQTESSETILKLLTDDLKDVRIKLECEVLNIEQINNKILINHKEEYDYAIISSGSSANIIPKKASIIYDYFSNLDLSMVKLKPVLVGLKTEEKLNELQGYRAKCILKYPMCSYQERGEVIFKENGISGICVMNASRYYKQNTEISLDLYPSSSLEEIIKAIEVRKDKYIDPKYYLDGICHPKMIDYLLKRGITKPDEVAKKLKNFTLKVIDTYSMEEAQVARGGIALEEINSTLNLKRYPNIYVAGEAMDIDGRCGGYNLLFAFICGICIAKELMKIENKD